MIKKGQQRPAIKPPGEQAVESFKVPPHSIEAEQSVLGGLMLDNTAWDKAIDYVNESDFYRYEHRLIFRAMCQLRDKNDPLDVITLSEALANMNELDNAGGLAYLIDLAKNTPSAANVVAYAQIMRERSVCRQMISVANGIIDRAFKPEGRDVADLLDAAEGDIFRIADHGRSNAGPVDIAQVLAQAVQRVDRLFRNKNTITGLSTGFKDLDEMTAGLQPSELVIVAGRPSMGKTAFAMNIVENAVIKEKKSVLVFSLEMPSESLVLRLISSLSRIEQHALRVGKLDGDDWDRFSSAVSMLTDTRLFIDETPGLTPTECRARSRRLVREQGELGLIVIDYLQLMTASGRRENRTAEISEISRSLKLMAKELSVPIVALSQLNRELEHRPNKRPLMSDLRESGAIEQDADMIAFIYRDEVYNKETEDKNKAEIIIGKQRNGPIGTVNLTFRGEYCRFESFAADRPMH